MKGGEALLAEAGSVAADGLLKPEIEGVGDQGMTYRYLGERRDLLGEEL